MISCMIRFYSQRILMINIIIFSLFMCISNTYAALKPHSEICSIPPKYCAFVHPCLLPIQCAGMIYPVCAYPYLQQFQYPYGACVPYGLVEYSPLPMQSAVMDPTFSPQSQTADVDPVFQHLLAYVYRGVRPNFDSNEPDYMSYAFAEQKLDIMKELPNMLDRIGCTVKSQPEYESVACMENVRARLLHIKRSLVWMSDLEKAMIFAWAFVMERKGGRAFYDLGFFKGQELINHLLKVCRCELPNYLYALTECTNIEVYGKDMRSTLTCERHQKAKDALCTIIPKEGMNSYSKEWKYIMGLRTVYLKGRFGFLLYTIFPDGDVTAVRSS